MLTADNYLQGLGSRSQGLGRSWQGLGNSLQGLRSSWQVLGSSLAGARSSWQGLGSSWQEPGAAGRESGAVSRARQEMCFLSGRLTGTGNILANREAGYGAVMGVTLSVDSHLDSFVAGAGLET